MTFTEGAPRNPEESGEAGADDPGMRVITDASARPRTTAERMLALVVEQEVALGPRPPGRRYVSPRSMVRETGTWHRPAEFPPDLARWRGPCGDCYATAARLAAARNLTYVEGLADPGRADAPGDALGLALDHAWVIDHTGQVIDPTWPEPGAAYLGIAIDLGFRAQILARRGTGRVAVLDWNSPDLLIDGLPPQAHPHGGQALAR